MSRFTINNIISSNYAQSQDWQARKNGGDKTLVKTNVIKILNLISGSILIFF